MFTELTFKKTYLQEVNIVFTGSLYRVYKKLTSCKHDTNFLQADY